MWTSKEIARALRGERAVIVQSWQQEAQARFWHMDKMLLTRRGTATRLASDTLTLLAGLLQARADGDSSPEEEFEPEASSSFLPEADAPGEDADAGGEGKAREQEASANGPDSIGTLVSAPEHALTDCAEQWSRLTVTWADARGMLSLLSAQTSQGLLRRGADADTLALQEGLLATITALVADRRVAKLEQELAASREEAAATQHLAGRFLANASHELRTPLTAILGFSELLIEETYGDVTQEQRTAIGHIENSAQNLLEVVNNLLDLLRIRAGKLTLQHRPVVVSALLHEVHAVLIPLSERKNVTFRCELSGDIGVIEADENILRHIVYHLLASALRATPQGGQVTLTAGRDEKWLTIVTRDTALHLPSEAVANMMDPFPRLENSPARGYEGWEVGLPLVRRYVELHEGALELDSLPGQGTTFRIRLPISRAARPAAL